MVHKPVDIMFNIKKPIPNSCRVYLSCGIVTNVRQGDAIEISYPHGLFINVDGKPVDLEHVIHISLVERLPIDLLLQQVKDRSANADATKKDSNDELDLVSSTLSLIDPVSYLRMTFPGRGKNCNHSNCFDLKTFLNSIIIFPDWKCPLCSSPLDYDDLVYDSDTTCVKLNPDGSWVSLNEEVVATSTDEPFDKQNEQNEIIDLTNSDDDEKDYSHVYIKKDPEEHKCLIVKLNLKNFPKVLQDEPDDKNETFLNDEFCFPSSKKRSDDEDAIILSSDTEYKPSETRIAEPKSNFGPIYRIDPPGSKNNPIVLE
ncbi:E3 SUMO protein ligase domain-containing protein [Rozella allomycis CSF55]|uniref:E3 SUMO protein ligase domain-containing protein n=1 Tax=Rozella allomycis (strain CSF55) TaxID=988480 RepID=A0A075ANB2_ROZAC|nr:E3 SUMO protein ligase domain-containing protein [Rozella allomycis CSF55]|eukprot:EPZ31297.1 E3 SUMO protein ligase domain-containing protein [Rozella allomycis CSF55]